MGRQPRAAPRVNLTPSGGDSILAQRCHHPVREKSHLTRAPETTSTRCVLANKDGGFGDPDKPQPPQERCEGVFRDMKLETNR